MLPVFQLGQFGRGQPTRDFDSVVLQIQPAGPDASTSFVDVSPKAHTMAATGNAQMSTADTKYSTASVLLDGTGDYIGTSTGLSDFRFGTGDFTLETWQKTSANTKVIFDFYGTSISGSYQLFMNASGYLVWYANDGGSAVAVATATSGAVNTGAWVHVAACRISGVIKLFAGGTEVASATDTRNYNNIAVTPFAVGAQVYSRNAAYDFNGRFDDSRVQRRGIYSAGFTPPAAAHPTS